jgi:hypothetical protein
MAAIVSAVVAGVSLLAGVAGKIHANNQRNSERAKERRAQKKLEAFERSRQQVIDQSGAIRDLKNQVNNPYANLAVATQAAELQIEQTDQALANTLDQVNRSGTGAGGATALARMAAASKAQVSASLEKQEVQNNQLRAEGQAKVDAAKMQLEQAALSEEVSAWGRREDRDLASLDRLSGLQENAQAAAMMHQQAGDAALMQGITNAASIYGSGLSGGQKSGTNHLGKLGSGTGGLGSTSTGLLSTSKAGGVGSGIPLGSFGLNMKF